MGQLFRMHAAAGVGEEVDYSVITELKRAVGAIRFEEIAEQATLELADGLGQLDRALREEDMTMCYRHALNVCGVSSQIGLVEVASVASAVMNCARTEDSPALSAVVARLNRVAEASLFTVFDLGA